MPDEPRAVLIAEIGSNTTRVTLVDAVAGEARLIGQAEVPSTTEPPYENAVVGLLEATARFVSVAAELPGVRLGLVTCEPVERIPPKLRERLDAHWRVEDALDPRQLAHWLHDPLGPLTTGGWTVTIDEAQPAGSITIARRISATRGEVSVRLVVDEYRALAP